jgi:ketosteroid isomerase-like protein
VTDSAGTVRLHIAKQFALHLGQRDVAQALPLLSPQVSYRVLGDHALAGTFTGPEAVANHLIQLADLTTGTYETLKWADWLIGEDHVAALADVQMQAEQRKFHAQPLFLMKFDLNDRISEITIFFESEAAALRFFGQEAPPES